MTNTYNETKNRQLQAMLEPERDRLTKYTPEMLCGKAKVVFNKERLMLLP